MRDWTDRLASLRGALADKLGARGHDLSGQLRRAGRRLPRRLRREAQLLVRAEEMGRHPKFARLVDPRMVARAEGRLSRHLEGIDSAAIRRGRAKDRVALLALYVLATSVLVVALLWWRGLV